jgi:hypothetical protein
MAEDFELGPSWLLREKYGLTTTNRPAVVLDPTRVPDKFRSWIPLAERWGIGDDIIRTDCVNGATPEELNELLRYGEVLNDVLSEWLAGPEAKSANPTEEYAAFTCLMMAWDQAKLIADRVEAKRGLQT